MAIAAGSNTTIGATEAHESPQSAHVYGDQFRAPRAASATGKDVLSCEWFVFGIGSPERH